MIGTLVKQRLNKDEEVTLSIDLEYFGGPLFQHQAEMHLGTISGIEVVDGNQVQAWGHGAYEGDEGRPLLVFHYLREEKSLRGARGGWCALYADMADDGLDLHKTSYGWQLSNRAGDLDESEDDVMPLETMIDHLLQAGKKVEWGWNSKDWIHSTYRSPGAKMLKVSFTTHSEHDTQWDGSVMLSSTDQAEAELHKNGDHFSLILPHAHKHLMKQ